MSRSCPTEPLSASALPCIREVPGRNIKHDPCKIAVRAGGLENVAPFQSVLRDTGKAGIIRPTRHDLFQLAFPSTNDGSCVMSAAAPRRQRPKTMDVKWKRIIPDYAIGVSVSSLVGREKRDVLSQRPRNHALRFIARDSFKTRWFPSFTMYPPMAKSRYRNVDNFCWT